jgi:lysophospholipase L1-like esterase
MEKIDRAELERLLLDPAVPESALRPYLTLDPIESQGFRPSVVANPALVDYGATEAAMALASLNSIARWRRQVQYGWKIGTWTGLRVVAEGDSWFQFPFLLDDVIDHLFDRWAIYCCSAAGDLLSDMARQDELSAAILAEKPDILLLSGGGNDLLGDGRLVRYLAPHAAGMSPADYVKPEFDALVATILDIYADLIRKALAAGASRIVCHSYDYAIPNNGPWLGRPMLKLGITDQPTQRAILKVLIDRFHAGLVAMAAGFHGKVIVADCRGLVADNEWYDELHPTNVGYGKVARVIRAAAEGVPVESIAPDALESMVVSRPLPVADAEAVDALLATDDDVLLAEIGRRAAIIELAPDAASGLVLELPQRLTEGIATSFLERGTALVDDLHRRLYTLLCGDASATAADRNRLRQSLGLDNGTLVGALTGALVVLGAPALLAPLVAALLVNRGIDPAWETTCRLWADALGTT